MDLFVTAIAACCLMNAWEKDIRADCAPKDAAPTGPVLPKRGDLSSPAPREPFDPTPPRCRNGIPPVLATYSHPSFGPPVNEHGQELAYCEERGKVVWRVA